LSFSTLKELREQFSSSDDNYDINQQILIAEFSETLFSLKNFIVMNEFAFNKIFKKYKKNFEDEYGPKFESELESKYFLTSKGLDRIMSPIHVNFL
jgi:SPX domain protein involved in polyphosphate accumulation